MMTTERKLKVAFAVAILVMAINAIVPIQTLFRTRASQESLLSSERMIQELSLVLSLLKDAETGQRGFIITGREEFLEPYHATLAHLDEHIKLVSDRTMNDPAQAQLFKQLQPLVKLRFVQFAELIDLRRSRGIEVAADPSPFITGKRTMDQIREVVRSMIVHEDVRRSALRRELDDSNNIAAIGSLIVTAVNVLLLTSISFFVFRTFKERRQAAHEMRDSSEQLAKGLAELEQRNREIVLLSRMARAIESPTSMKEAFETISLYCERLLPATSGALYLFRNSGDLLEKEAQWGEPQNAREMFEPTACWALRRGQPHKVMTPDDVICPHRGDEVLKSGPYLFALNGAG